MFPMNRPNRGFASSIAPSAPVPTFAPANSDNSMDVNRRDRTQEQYSPNKGYQPPAIGPSNPMTPNGTIPGMGMPGQGNININTPQNPNMGMTPPMMSAQSPFGNTSAPGIGPSYMENKSYMNSNLPRMNNDIQTNANRISQGMSGFRDTSKNPIDQMGFDMSKRIPINRGGQY